MRPVEKRETVDRQPSTVNRDPELSDGGRRTADGDRRSSLVARHLEIPLCLPYLHTYLLYLLTYRFQNGLFDEVRPLEKRETLDRQPSTVHQDPELSDGGRRTADDGR